MALIQNDAGESGVGQSRGDGVRLDWHERAFSVNDAVEPPVRDFKGEEAAAWLHHAVNFGEGAVL